LADEREKSWRKTVKRRSATMRLSDIHPEARSVWLVQTGFIIVRAVYKSGFSLVFRQVLRLFQLVFH
jgi:hypothetical protein